MVQTDMDIHVLQKWISSPNIFAPFDIFLTTETPAKKM
jgi:hypothetical protein